MIAMPSSRLPELIAEGVTVPRLFYGTAWKEDRTAPLTLRARAAGFRAIDTANQRRHYHEAAVGEAIAASGTAREELFLQTKFTHLAGQDHRLPYDPDAPIARQVAQSIDSSLEHLRTSYVDSLVLHGPSSRYGLTEQDWEAWGAMAEAQHAGKTRLLGVSNVSVAHLDALLASDAAKPACVQNRCFASTGWDAAVRDRCRQAGIVYQGFSLLTANARELATPAIARMAVRLGYTVPQLVFSFALAVGIVPLTGTTDATHMREDLATLGLRLEAEDLETIERAGLRP
jgi:diketogulonate reductase-like aldo/keto reductase